MLQKIKIDMIQYMKKLIFYNILIIICFIGGCDNQKHPTFIKETRSKQFERNFNNDYRFESEAKFFLNDGDLYLSYYKNGNLKDLYIYNDDLDKKLILKKQYDSTGNLIVEKKYNWKIGYHTKKIIVGGNDSIISFYQLNAESEIIYK